MHAYIARVYRLINAGLACYIEAPRARGAIIQKLENKMKNSRRGESHCGKYIRVCVCVVCRYVC